MKPPTKTFADLRSNQGAGAKPPSDKVFSPPTPKVSRQQKAKVLTPAERAAFLASRPDLKPKG